MTTEDGEDMTFSCPTLCFDIGGYFIEGCQPELFGVLDTIVFSLHWLGLLRRWRAFCKQRQAMTSSVFQFLMLMKHITYFTSDEPLFSHRGISCHHELLSVR